MILGVPSSDDFLLKVPSTGDRASVGFASSTLNDPRRKKLTTKLSTCGGAGNVGMGAAVAKSP
jgi:hypothetical protein